MPTAHGDRRGFLTFCGATCGAAIASAATGSVARGQGQASRAGSVTIDTDFPGGNIVLERIDGDDAYLHQDQRDTRDFWFYWSFRVRGAAGRTLFGSTSPEGACWPRGGRP